MLAVSLELTFLLSAQLRDAAVDLLTEILSVYTARQSTAAGGQAMAVDGSCGLVHLHVICHEIAHSQGPKGDLCL